MGIVRNTGPVLIYHWKSGVDSGGATLAFAVVRLADHISNRIVKKAEDRVLCLQVPLASLDGQSQPAPFPISSGLFEGGFE